MKRLAYLLFIIFSAWAVSFGGGKPPLSPPVAHRGVMDLRDWDFAAAGPVELGGPWEFYRERFLVFHDFKTRPEPEPVYVQSGKVWNHTVIDDRKMPGTGYATYRLKVMTAGELTRMGLRSPDASSACRVYINDTLIYEAGVPGESEEKTTAFYSPAVVPVTLPSDEFEIIVHVSNFHHWMGGLWKNIRFGKVSDLQAEREKTLAVSFMLFGAIWIIGFYHISLFLLRKKDKAPLLLGIFCLLIGFRAILHDEQGFRLLFPGMSFGLHMVLVYLSVYLAVPVLLRYMRLLFPDEISGKVDKGVMWICLMFSLIVILFPSRWFSLTLTAFQGFMALTAVYCGFAVMRAVMRRRAGALVFFIGFLIFTGTVVNDILYTRMVISTGYYIPVGMVFFLSAQAFLISQRFSAAFETAERQGVELRAENDRRRVIENDLKKSEEKYRQMMAFLPIPVGEYDFDYNILYANQAALDWFGFSREDIEAGVNMSGLIPKESVELIVSRMAMLARGDAPGPVEVKMHRKDGSELWGEATPSIIFQDEKPVAVRTCFVDISERKKNEAALLHWAEQEKYALVGQVAGKMAHDFNNVLGAIMGITEITLMNYREEAAKEALSIVLEQSEQGAVLTRNLVAFAKDQELREEFFQINEKISLVLNLLKKELKDIRVNLALGSQVPQILADPGMVEHALVNLMQNAVHAVCKASGPEIRIKTDSDGQSVFVEIRDNGCGIPEDYHDDIYTPAFTLKGSRDERNAYPAEIKGSGYGMANVKKCIDRHRGSISFVSRENSGTTFVISFPVVEKELTANEKEKMEERAISRGKRILVVEDEPVISDIQMRILSGEPFCHSVKVAAGAQEAMEVFDREPFDLVSLDHMLAGKQTGYDVYEHIRKHRPSVPVIFVSGNIRFLKSMEGLKAKDPYMDHLPKPCRNMAYARMINEWLIRTA
ncbi:MAG: ATP-binding protein [Desulfobacteraceae bacterium]|nr:ATP-binding protein [Desulfobacteraceae bacterium]